MGLSKMDVRRWAKESYGADVLIEKNGSTWTLRLEFASPTSKHVKIRLVGAGKTLDAAKLKCEENFMDVLQETIERQAREKVDDGAFVLSKPTETPPVYSKRLNLGMSQSLLIK